MRFLVSGGDLHARVILNNLLHLVEAYRYIILIVGFLGHIIVLLGYSYTKFLDLKIDPSG